MDLYNNQILFSIIIPFYNGEKYISQTIKWFLPAAYLRRFGDYASMRKKRLNVDAGDESALKIGMQRAALLEKYKIQG